ncbi:hypothetical protein C8R43DRAFT_1125157 [Mycena crocata]|nr:hypothetical protein C8R43DRAFT_1125157 [Mycena crocata]
MQFLAFVTSALAALAAVANALPSPIQENTQGEAKAPFNVARQLGGLGDLLKGLPLVGGLLGGLPLVGGLLGGGGDSTAGADATVGEVSARAVPEGTELGEDSSAAAPADEGLAFPL